LCVLEEIKNQYIFLCLDIWEKLTTENTNLSNGIKARNLKTATVETKNTTVHLKVYIVHIHQSK